MIFDTMRGLIARQLEISQDTITMETDIIRDLGADSLDLVELVMMIEEQFNIIVTDETVANMTTVGQFVEYLERSL